MTTRFFYLKFAGDVFFYSHLYRKFKSIGNYMGLSIQDNEDAYFGKLLKFHQSRSEEGNSFNSENTSDVNPYFYEEICDYNYLFII